VCSASLNIKVLVEYKVLCNYVRCFRGANCDCPQSGGCRNICSLDEGLSPHTFHIFMVLR
jgi:hypothetical protein